ncbi:hypothetical protein, partial [Bifidobacterium aquikefiri]|uniref:hypothetical protein n=1 Tax=Bifidobacterium aquikefiri TaxID=1653207 RepID=UPI0039EA7AC1
ACKGEISRLAALARDDKGSGFGRGDEGRGDGWDGWDGWDGGHRHWIVPALLVPLRYMMVPQCGYGVAFISSQVTQDYQPAQTPVGRTSHGMFHTLSCRAVIPA